MRFSWIAVALATAIRLFAGPEAWTAAAVAALAIVAWLLCRGAAAPYHRARGGDLSPSRRHRRRRLALAVQSPLARVSAEAGGAPRSRSGRFAPALRLARGRARFLGRPDRARNGGKEQNRAALFLLLAVKRNSPAAARAFSTSPASRSPGGARTTVRPRTAPISSTSPISTSRTHGRTRRRRHLHGSGIRPDRERGRTVAGPAHRRFMGHLHVLPRRVPASRGRSAAFRRVQACRLVAVRRRRATSARRGR